jgi:hypothetical protein
VLFRWEIYRAEAPRAISEECLRDPAVPGEQPRDIYADDLVEVLLAVPVVIVLGCNVLAVTAEQLPCPKRKATRNDGHQQRLYVDF